MKMSFKHKHDVTGASAVTVVVPWLGALVFPRRTIKFLLAAHVSMCVATAVPRPVNRAHMTTVAPTRIGARHDLHRVVPALLACPVVGRHRAPCPLAGA